MTVNTHEFTPTKDRPIKEWAYTDFRQHLLAIDSSRERLFSLWESPQTLDLNSSWREAMSKMQKETFGDSLERWSFIGVDAEKGRVVLRKLSAVGEKTHVPGNLIREEEGKLEIKFGLLPVGDIHSHPFDLNVQQAPDNSGFSAEDLLRLVSPSHYFLILVVDNGIVSLAFRTKETRDLKASSQKDPQDVFASEWYKLLGKKSHKEINVEIARNHGLALYRGKLNEKLKRVYP